MPHRRAPPPCPPEWPCGGSRSAGGRHRAVSSATYYRHRNKAMDVEVERINRTILNREGEQESHYSVPKSPERKRRTLRDPIEEENPEDDLGVNWQIESANGKLQGPLERTEMSNRRIFQ